MGFKNQVAVCNIHNGWSFFGCWKTVVKAMVVLVFFILGVRWMRYEVMIK
jgi:hypothetical protein